MYKKPLLRACILCETPLDAEVSKKLLEYFSTYGLAIRIYIKNIHPTRKVICTPGSLGAPMLNTKFSFIIRTQDQLYKILVDLICLALEYLNQTGYHPTGDMLTIHVPSAPTEDMVYTFGWWLNH